MSECPYKNEIKKFLELIMKPMEEFSGFPPCPFAAKELNQNKLMIEIFEPEKDSIVDMVKRLDASKFDSGLFLQKTKSKISHKETYEYQNFINKVLEKSGYEKYKCICFNPEDPFEADGFNVRSKLPYFLINIIEKNTLFSANKKMKKTKYYDKMNQEYLDYLNVKRHKK